MAEILTRMMPLLHELGVNAGWGVIKGDESFFNVTKTFLITRHVKDYLLLMLALDYPKDRVVYLPAA